MARTEGERLHTEQRRRFWTIMGGLLVLGLAAGFASGLLMGRADDGQLPPWAPIAGTIGVVVFVLGGVYGSWKFFKNVDEVEVADNLWGSLVGLYAYAFLFPAWWALNRLGQVRDPDDWAIFGTVMIVACAAYLIRKWNAR